MLMLPGMWMVLVLGALFEIVILHVWISFTSVLEHSPLSEYAETVAIMRVFVWQRDLVTPVSLLKMIVKMLLTSSYLILGL